MRVALALVAVLTFTSCYTIRASAPPGGVTTLAGPGELCMPVLHRRVHYALAGLIAINDNEVTVPGNARVRVITEADALDMVLRALGAVFTWGLYGGTQSATVEVCAPIAAAGGPPGMAPMMLPSPEPPTTVQLVVPGAGSPASTGPARRPARDSDQPMCKLPTDCEFGTFCRDRGDGIQLCMGHGGRGDFCASPADCGYPLFCRASGDGYQRCM